MAERFPDEFVTWHHKTPLGVEIDEVFGMDSREGKLWLEMARQIFCEQGEEYREINHFENGAPYIEGYPGRISITHTKDFFAVAWLPKTPEVDLTTFNVTTALGIDAEPIDRTQVLKVRNRFLSDSELAMIPEENLAENVLAWTIKEALYKAAMTEGIDFRNNLRIIELPEIDKAPEKRGKKNLGQGEIVMADGRSYEMRLYSYESYGCVVTVALF